MQSSEPFLFRFKQKCLSPNRCVPQDGFYYDHERAMVMTVEGGQATPAIDSPNAKGPQTKKFDIEKGEDQKDNWMWRR